MAVHVDAGYDAEGRVRDGGPGAEVKLRGPKTLFMRFSLVTRN